ncbi:hypothetical protein B9Z55_025855 [Caenorhabditis nigoni]|uniref:Uncharacterized protein n=1 Tax=Caenorhabditis nigoni TaxID=1611254 RepID=A0A2G5T0J0_9PELO|nr:hypothetical protein B9Z55_025855 [Caenorhabditis nigoni]
MALDYRQFHRRHYVHVFENDMGVCNKGHWNILGSGIVGIPGENGSRNRLYPNFIAEEKVFIGDGMKYFLLDKEDKRRLNEMRNTCQTMEEKYARTKEVVCNMIKFQEFYPQKRIYLRNVLNKTPSLPWFVCLVFYEEAVEAAVIALKQQGAPLATIQKVEKVLERNRVDKEDTKYVRTITLTDLDRILETYGVDRSLITIVPDPSSFALSRNCHENGSVIRTLSPNLNVVMDLSNTLFFIFTSGVQGSDVSPVPKHNQNSGEKKMNRCKNLLQRYYKELNHNYVLASKVEKQIEKIFVDYAPFLVKHHDFETRFFDQGAWTKISFKEFNMVAKALDINRYDVPSEFDNAYPIWLARMLFSIGHLQQAYKQPTEMVRCLIRQFSYRTPPDSVDSSHRFMLDVMNNRELPMGEADEEGIVTRFRGRRRAEDDALKGDRFIPWDFTRQIMFKQMIKDHNNPAEYEIRELQNISFSRIYRRLAPLAADRHVPDALYHNRPPWIAIPIPAPQPQPVPPAVPRPITPRPIVQPPVPVPVRADSPEEFLNQNPPDNDVPAPNPNPNPAPNPIRGRWMMRAVDLARMRQVDVPAPPPANQLIPQLAGPPQVNPRDNHPDLFRRIDELRRLMQPVDNVVLNMNDMNVMPLGADLVNWNQGLDQVQNVQPNANLFAPVLAAPPQPALRDDDHDMDWEEDAERFVPPPVNNVNNFNNFNAIDMPPMGQFGQWQFGQNDMQRVQPQADQMAPFMAAHALQVAPQVAPQADLWDQQQRFMNWIAQAQEFMQQFAPNVPNVPDDMDQILPWQWDQEEIARQAWEQQELQNQLQNQFGAHQFQ